MANVIMQAPWFAFSKPPPRLPQAQHIAAASAANKALPLASFIMNPNTGALIPVRHAVPDAGGLDQAFTPEPSQSSLLGTPAVPLLASGPRTQPGSSAHSVQAPAATVARLAASVGVGAAERSKKLPVIAEEGPQFRPPSPKYDERAGGFFTPLVTGGVRGRLSTGQQPSTDGMRSRSAAPHQQLSSGPAAKPRTGDPQALATAAFASTPAAAQVRAGVKPAGTAAAAADAFRGSGTLHVRVQAQEDEDAEASSGSSAPPSPKWDETAGFFSKPKRRRSRKVATGTPATAAASGAAQRSTDAPRSSTGGAVRDESAPGPALAVSPVLQPQPQGSVKRTDSAPGTRTPLPQPAFTAMRPPMSRSQLSGAPANGGANDGAPHLGYRTAVPNKGHQLTILSLEILAETRGKLLPDPKYDAVLAVALTVWYDHEDVQDHRFETRLIVCEAEAVDTSGHSGEKAPQGGNGAAAAVAGTHVSEPAQRPIPRSSPATLDAQTDRVTSEPSLLSAVLVAVCALDPDIITAFDVMRGSIGYLEARARELDMKPPLLRQLGRCPRHPGMAFAS